MVRGHSRGGGSLRAFRNLRQCGTDAEVATLEGEADTQLWGALDPGRDAFVQAHGQGNLRRLNRAAEVLIGLTELEVAGRPCHEALTVLDASKRPRLEDIVARTLREGVGVDLKGLRLVAKDGTERPAERYLGAALGCAEAHDRVGAGVETIPHSDPAREDLEEIKLAGDRAADLTRQLLARRR